MDRADTALRLYKGNDLLLVTQTLFVAFGALRRVAVVRLIGLHGFAGAAERASASVDHGFADAMREEPRALVGDAEHAVELVRAHALLTGAEQVNGHESLAEGDMRSLENRADRDGKLLAAGAGIGALSADELINNDLKFFETHGQKVAIAQVEVPNLRELAPRLAEIQDALSKLADTRNLALAMLMVTDVVLGNSILVPVGQGRIIASLPYARLADETLDAPGVVSRKKQLLQLKINIFIPMQDFP